MIRTFLVASLLSIALAGTAQSTLQQELKELQDSHQYNELWKRNHATKSNDQLFFDAVYYNASNQPYQSLQCLKKLIKKQPSYANSYEYWKLRNDNEVKLFAYQAAFLSSTKLIEQFANSMSEEELEDEKNNVLIWKSLSGQPPQSFAKYKEVILPTKRDLAQLITTPVKMNGIEKSFVFDTGAGLNCITESLAKEMNLTFLPDYQAQVKSFTGASNYVKIAIAPVLQMSGFTVYNTPFLVYPDDAFTFSKGKYVIHGIIGFPIAKEVGSITFEKEQITFSNKNKADKKQEKNLFLEHLRPVLLLTYEGQQLPYNLDTGANHSKFSKAFYDRFAAKMQDAEQVETSASGAGGQVKTSQYMVLKDQLLQVGTQTIVVPELMVNKEEYDVYGPQNYGNIGQDILSQFSKMILSFKYNYFEVEK